MSCNLSSLIEKRFAGEKVDFLRFIGKFADEYKFNIYLVGGSVRDLILNRIDWDMDFTIEGDGIKFAKELSDRLNCKIQTYPKFLTSTLTLPDNILNGIKIDIVSARSEKYPSPAVLPVVKMGTIRDDLFRRDFTVNCLAIQLNHDKFGTLIDYFGGKNDLENKLIRVLHNKSFIDDPTRILRAIRFEQKLGFTIESETLQLLKSAVDSKILKKVTGERVRDELIILLSQENSFKGIKRFNELNILKLLHPKFKYTNEVEEILVSIEELFNEKELFEITSNTHKWMVISLAILYFIPHHYANKIVKRMNLPNKIKQGINQIHNNKELNSFIENPDTISHSAIYKKLKPLSLETILYFLSKTKSQIARDRYILFLTKLSKTKIELTGEDISNLGLSPSPLYKKILDSILYDKLDGKVRSRSDEIELAKKIIEKKNP